jgi:hypothetical protein
VILEAMRSTIGRDKHVIPLSSVRSA